MEITKRQLRRPIREEILREQSDPRSHYPRGRQVRQSWGELMEVLVEAVTTARAFGRLNDPEGVGEPPVEETGFGGSEGAELSALLSDIWEGAGFDPSEIFKGY